jgi:hypothetical protein
MLFAFVRCPVDTRDGDGAFSGVPLTYGNDTLVKEINELYDELQKEFVLKRAFIGADYKMFDEHDQLVRSGLYKRFSETITNIGDKPFWEVFSPDIRVGAYIDGINFKLGQLEKAVGVNRGMLTDMATSDATATAIEFSSFDTEALSDGVHKNIETAVKDLVYALDFLADALNLAPKGDYDVKFGWMNWSERSADRWRQLLDGQGAGAVRPEELRMYLFDEAKEAALENLPETVAMLNAD